jgi:hypothetical protein
MLLGCPTTTGGQCSADDGCPVDTFCRGGVCVRDEGDSGTGRTDSGNPDASTLGDAGAVDASGTDGSVTPDAGQGCIGADDGVLTSLELPLSLGTPLRMVETHVDGGVPVSLTGTVAGDGVLEWDFSAALTGDTPVQIVASALDGQWFASEFPEGGYVAPLDGTGTTLGIYKRTDAEILLLGVASVAADETLLKHDPPVKVLRFPITLGQSFSTQTTTTGKLPGNAFYNSDDTYDFLVDGRGRVKTPAGTFSTLRVRVKQTVVVNIFVFPFTVTYSWWRYSFLSSCYSTVAAVSSKQGEEASEFSSAAEVRRLGLP